MRSKITAAIVVAAVILCLSHFWAYGEEARGSITLGSVRLVLGMPEKAVIAALTPEYDVVNVGGTGYLWHVQGKHGPPFEVYGSLRFQDGKLIVVQKSWGPENQQKGFELARNLYLALEQLPKDTLSACNIELTQVEDTMNESKYIGLICGDKRVMVAISRIVGGPFAPREAASIDEVLK